MKVMLQKETVITRYQSHSLANLPHSPLQPSLFFLSLSSALSALTLGDLLGRTTKQGTWHNPKDPDMPKKGITLVFLILFGRDWNPKHPIRSGRGLDSQGLYPCLE